MIRSFILVTRQELENFDQCDLSPNQLLTPTVALDNNKKKEKKSKVEWFELAF